MISVAQQAMIYPHPQAPADTGKAVSVLDEFPNRIHARCSANIIKNVKSVVIPNSGGRKGRADIRHALGCDINQILFAVSYVQIALYMSLVPAAVFPQRRRFARLHCKLYLS